MLSVGASMINFNLYCNIAIDQFLEIATSLGSAIYMQQTQQKTRFYYMSNCQKAKVGVPTEPDY